MKVESIIHCTQSRYRSHPLSVANIIDVKTADSDQLIRGFGENHYQLA